MSTTTTVSLLRLPAVRERTGLSRSSIYARVQDGSFPPPVQLGARAVAWASDSIDHWIADRVRVSRSQADRCASKTAGRQAGRLAMEGA